MTTLQWIWSVFGLLPFFGGFKSEPERGRELRRGRQKPAIWVKTSFLEKNQKNNPFYHQLLKSLSSSFQGATALTSTLNVFSFSSRANHPLFTCCCQVRWGDVLTLQNNPTESIVGCVPITRKIMTPVRKFPSNYEWNNYILSCSLKKKKKKHSLKLSHFPSHNLTRPAKQQHAFPRSPDTLGD